MGNLKTKDEKPVRFQKPNRSRIKNILFDLDGTISDPKEGIINGILYSVEKLGLKKLDKEVLGKFIGPPLHLSYQDKFELSETAAENAVTVFREYYSEKGWCENYIFENIVVLLEALKNEGFKLFVATSKPTFFAQKIIKHFQIDHYFIEIVGSNLDNSRSDKADIIKCVLEKHNLNNEETLMVGDTKFDILGAKKNYVQSIAVTYGTESKKELEQFEPDYILNNCLDILTYLRPVRFQKPDRSEIAKPDRPISITAFSHPYIIENESHHINQLFQNGLDEFVLRKLNWIDDEVLDLLDLIDESFHDRIYVCDRPNIASKKRIRGLHCSNAFYDSMLKTEQNQLHQKLRERGQKKSISAHNPKEWQKRKRQFDQLYLCPIFESISKPGYKGDWDHDLITNEIENGEHQETLIALGGIHANNFVDVIDMGFEGVGVLGTFWKDPENCVKELKQLQKKLKPKKSELV